MIVVMVSFFGLGVLTWSFLEYVIHRWAGHDRRFRRNLFAKEHIRHHIEGDYFAPTTKKAIVTSMFAAALAPIAVLLLGVEYGLSFLAGLIGFYVTYEVLHRRNHTHPGIGFYGRWARRHHFYHHFENAKMNHGVTSPLWDIVFRTYKKPGVIRVPSRLCMTWLRDPESNLIRPEHRGAYILQ